MNISMMNKKAMRCIGAPRCRPSFTLIELLVAIAIIGIMAGMALYSLSGAQTDARNARTRSTISKLNEIMLQRWEEYRYRPVNVLLTQQMKQPVITPNGTRVPYSPREKARVRMLMLRDMMRMELPDRVSDLLYEPSQYKMVWNSGSEYLMRPVPPGWGIIYQALRNRVNGNPAFTSLGLTLPPTYAGGALPGSNAAPNFVPPGGTPADWNDQVQSAELLYLIVATSNFNGSNALEYFRPSEVADTDNDGLWEFVDAWQQPIRWIRWPAGYPGDLVRYAGEDAMDPLKTDWRYRPNVNGAAVDEGWRPRTLVPLIISRGQDGQIGLIAEFNPPIVYALMQWPTAQPNTAFGASAAHYQNGPYYYPDPHFTWDYQASLPNQPGSEIPYPESHPSGFRANQLGSVPQYMDPPTNSIPNEFWADDITNHDIILEP